MLRLLAAAALGAMMATPAYADARSDAHEAFVALNKGDYDACLQLYTKALDSGTLDALGKANAHLNRAVCHSRERHLPERLADDNAAVELFSPLTAAGHSVQERAEALQGRGIVYYNMRKLDLAHQDFDAALALTPGKGELHRNRGDLFRLERKYTEAISEYDTALKLNPQDIETLDARGYTRWLQSQQDAGLTDLNAAIRLTADYADAYAHRALVYAAQRDYARAIADNTTFITLRPNETLGYEQRARIYRITKDYVNAAGDYSKLIELDPDSAASNYYERGMAYADADDDKRAIADLTAAINRDPKRSFYYFARAELYLKSGHAEESLVDYTQGFANFPADGHSYFGYLGRGQAEFAAGQFKEAAADFRRAGEIMRTQFKHDMLADQQLWLHLAARRAGEDDRVDFAAQAAKLDRGRWPGPLVSYFLGEVQQDTVWAAVAASAEDTKKAKTCEANFYLGEVAVADGNIDAAQDSFGVAIARCTSNKVMQFIAKTERERLEAKH